MGSVVKLNSRPYYLDRRQFARVRAKDYRNEPDTGERTPQERGLKANEIWLRVWNDWSLGAGQELADTRDSNPRRFRSSINLDPFHTTGELRLAGALTEKVLSPALAFSFTMASTGADIVIAETSGPGARLYHGNLDQGFVNHTPWPYIATDITAWGNTFYILTSGGYVQSMTISQTNVATVTNVGAVIPAGSAPYTCIGAANGRLIIGANRYLYEMDSAGVKTIIYTHPNSKFRWKGIEESSQGIYVWGWEEFENEFYDAAVFFMTAEEYNGALAPPYKVLPLPEGEVVANLLFYGGYVFIATNVGIRMAQVNELGYLVYGPALEVPGANALWGRGEDIYFGFAGYEIGSAVDTGVDTDEYYYGVGVIKLRELVDNLTPPFAMVYARGMAYSENLSPYSAVMDIVMDKDDKIFFVDNMPAGSTPKLRYVSTQAKADYGVIRMGFCNFGTNEDIRILSAGLKAHTQQLNTCRYALGVRYINLDPDYIYNTFEYAGYKIIDNVLDQVVDVNVDANIKTHRVELVLGVGREIAAVNPSPKVFQTQFEVSPIHFYSEKFTLPMLFADWIRDDYGVDVSLDLEQEWQILSDLMNDRTFIELELGEEKFRGFVQQLEMKPETLMEFSRPFENVAAQHSGMASGFIYVTFHTIPGY